MLHFQKTNEFIGISGGGGGGGGGGEGGRGVSTYNSMYVLHD